MFFCRGAGVSSPTTTPTAFAVPTAAGMVFYFFLIVSRGLAQQNYAGGFFPPFPFRQPTFSGSSLKSLCASPVVDFSPLFPHPEYPFFSKNSFSF